MISSGRSLLHDALKKVWHNKSYMLIPVKFAISGIIVGIAVIGVSLLVIVPINLMWSSESTIAKVAARFLSYILPMYVFFFGSNAYFLAIVRNQKPSVWQALDKGWKALRATWWLVVSSWIYYAASLYIPALNESLLLRSISLIVWFVLVFMPYLVVDGESSLSSVARSSVDYFKRGWKPYLGIWIRATLYLLAALFTALVVMGLAIYDFGLHNAGNVILLLKTSKLLILLGSVEALILILFSLFLSIAAGIADAQLYLELREEE